MHIQNISIADICLQDFPNSYSSLPQYTTESDTDANEVQAKIILIFFVVDCILNTNAPHSRYGVVVKTCPLKQQGKDYLFQHFGGAQLPLHLAMKKCRAHIFGISCVQTWPGGIFSTEKLLPNKNDQDLSKKQKAAIPVCITKIAMVEETSLSLSLSIVLIKFEKGALQSSKEDGGVKLIQDSLHPPFLTCLKVILVQRNIDDVYRGLIGPQ